MGILSVVQRSAVTLPAAQVVPGGFTDIVRESYNNVVLNFNSNSEAEAETAASNDAAATFKRVTQRDLQQEYDARVEEDRYFAERYSFGEFVESRARMLKDSDPTLYNSYVSQGGMTDLREGVKARVNMSDEALDEAIRFNRSNWKGTAEFIGGMGAAFKDPVQLAAMVGTAPMAIGRTLLSAVGKEALVGAVTEAALQKEIMGWQETLGKDYTLADAVSATVFAGAVGGIFGGGVYGLDKLLRAANAAKDPTVNLALNTAAREVDIANAVPKRYDAQPPTPAEMQAHSTALIRTSLADTAADAAVLRGMSELPFKRNLLTQAYNYAHDAAQSVAVRDVAQELTPYQYARAQLDRELVYATPEQAKQIRKDIAALEKRGDLPERYAQAPSQQTQEFALRYANDLQDAEGLRYREQANRDIARMEKEFAVRDKEANNPKRSKKERELLRKQADSVQAAIGARKERLAADLEGVATDAQRLREGTVPDRWKGEYDAYAKGLADALADEAKWASVPRARRREMAQELVDEIFDGRAIETANMETLTRLPEDAEIDAALEGLADDKLVSLNEDGSGMTVRQFKEEVAKQQSIIDAVRACGGVK